MLLKYLPVVLVPAVAAGVLVGLVAAQRPRQLRQLIVLIVSGGAAALSIWYFPDFIHIAFIGPVFLVAAAEALEWAARRWSDRAPARLAATRGPARTWLAAGVALGIALAVGLALRDGAAPARATASVLKEQFRYPHDTAFGRIDFPVRWEPILIDHTRALLGETASNELFAYPNTSEPYLTTGGKNPTPYQYFYSHVSPRRAHRAGPGDPRDARTSRTSCARDSSSVRRTRSAASSSTTTKSSTSRRSKGWTSSRR